MQIDNRFILVSGREITLDVPPKLVDSNTLVPIRTVAEGMDDEIKWDDDTQTVLITKVEETAVTPTNPPKHLEVGEMY